MTRQPTNPEPSPRVRARPAAHAGERAGHAWIWFVFGICVLAPGLGVLVRTIEGIAHAGIADMAMTPARWTSLVRTIVYAGLIATLASALAWPVAAVVSRARAVWLVVLATPMLLPSYLAYAGWSIARAPTTTIGRWIAAAPERGTDWIPLAVGRGLAVWGLSLWAWPLAAVVIAAGLRAAGPDVVESLRLERCGPWRGWRTQARSVWPSIAAAWGLVALLMVGSAVPLHVARVETYAIRVWMTLDEHPTEPWRAWLTAWPLVVLAIGAGWAVSGRLARAGRRLTTLATGENRALRPSPASVTAAALPWILAVVVPFGLFWSSMGSPRALGRLLDRAGGGLATSAVVGCVVGLLAVSLCLAAAQATAAARGRLGGLRIVLAVAVAWALLPGVLVGAATAQMMRLPGIPDALAQSAAPMVIAHLSRVAFLPMLVGIWLGAGEAGGISETRLLDGATGLANWARTSLRSVIGPALAVGLACACLSFHEIESSVQVQPPGIDHMAQRLLQWLHYEQMTELSAAGVFLLGLGIAASGLVVLATTRPKPRTAERTRR